MVSTPTQPAELCGAPAQSTPPDLTIDDAARLLGCTNWLVYKECRRGRIKHVRIGKAIRFRREWIDAYLAAATVTPEGYAPATIPEAI